MHPYASTFWAILTINCNLNFITMCVKQYNIYQTNLFKRNESIFYSGGLFEIRHVIHSSDTKRDPQISLNLT